MNRHVCGTHKALGCETVVANINVRPEPRCVKGYTAPFTADLCPCQGVWIFVGDKEPMGAEGEDIFKDFGGKDGDRCIFIKLGADGREGGDQTGFFEEKGEVGRIHCMRGGFGRNL